MLSTLISTMSLLAGGALAMPAGTTLHTLPANYTKGFHDPIIQSSVGGRAVCVSGIIEVTASAENFNIQLEPPRSQVDLTELILELTEINSTLEERIVGGSTHVSGTYGIYSQLCVPNTATLNNVSTVQFLVHGGGFDRLYWDNAPGYSYVDYAAEKGYTTFLYDRLGTGLSDHPDPIQVVQIQLHVAIAHELVQLLRTGEISSQGFENVIGVGHSYGCVQIGGVTSVYPKDFDAVVLTGASANPDGMVANVVGQEQTIAALNSPHRFSNLSYGYTLPGTIEGLQYGFFRAPNFDPSLLDLAESIKQVQGLGELVAFGTPNPSTNFTGPLFVVDGENDLPNCFGNCYYPYNRAARLKDVLYPSASNKSGWYIVPGTGHGVNFHYGAKDAYARISAFLKTNGF